MSLLDFLGRNKAALVPYNPDAGVQPQQTASLSNATVRQLQQQREWFRALTESARAEADAVQAMTSASIARDNAVQELKLQREEAELMARKRLLELTREKARVDAALEAEARNKQIRELARIYGVKPETLERLVSDALEGSSRGDSPRAAYSFEDLLKQAAEGGGDNRDSYGDAKHSSR